MPEKAVTGSEIALVTASVFWIKSRNSPKWLVDSLEKLDRFVTNVN